MRPCVPTTSAMRAMTFEGTRCDRLGVMEAPYSGEICIVLDRGSPPNRACDVKCGGWLTARVLLLTVRIISQDRGVHENSCSSGAGHHYGVVCVRVCCRYERAHLRRSGVFRTGREAGTMCASGRAAEARGRRCAQRHGSRFGRRQPECCVCRLDCRNGKRANRTEHDHRRPELRSGTVNEQRENLGVMLQ